MYMQNNEEREKQINEIERLEEDSLEQVDETILNTFKDKANEVEQNFNEGAEKIEQEFKKKLDKIEKKYAIQFVVLILGMLLIAICSVWFVRWIGTDGFTDYYRPFDEIKGMVAESIEEPFSLSIVFVNTSEATVKLDFEGETNDTSFALENVKWNMQGKQLYIKESVVKTLIEKYETSKNSQ